MTATFKHTKSALVREGYDPVAIGDAIYFNDRERQAFVRLDKALYDRIQSGQIPGKLSMKRHSPNIEALCRRASVSFGSVWQVRQAAQAPA